MTEIWKRGKFPFYENLDLIKWRTAIVLVPVQNLKWEKSEVKIK